MNLTLLVNPLARQGRAARAGIRAAQAFRHAGVRTTVISGGSEDEARTLLRSALDAGTDAVVVVGGDGSARLAVGELAGSDVPLGIVPAGTGNDLATAIGHTDADALVAAVAADRRRRVDVARVRREDGTVALFGSMLASGFDSRVNDRANRMRRPRGAARYTIAILQELVALRDARFQIDAVAADGTSLRRDGRLILAALGNGATYGGGIPMCPDADLTDGLLDLTLVRTVSRARFLRLLPRVYRGTHGSIDEVEMLRVRSVRIASPGASAYADGDRVGALPLEIDVLPRALSVFDTRSA